MAALMLHEQQLPLPVQLPDHAQFSNFVLGDNAQAHAHLARLPEATWQPQDQFTLLFGGSGRGKTHLLCALCEAFADAGRSSIYLPLSELANPQAVAALNGIESYDVIALDDIHAVIAIPEWANALFALFNRVTDKRDSYLVCTSLQSTARLPIALPDLRSRLQLAVSFHLKTLSDSEKVQAMQQHAKARGLELAADVGEYMMHRLSRDMHQLMSVLDELDKASMARQRRLTLPFIKQVLEF
ncbi:DnaA regulatory inactivator Hda [Aliidiomarina shirensis]|uniref:DnaA regulatory inactivator Hda n=1 Tax=Aliidiomarina shirensis TaxID=1048642 RepID=A0A432WXL5_9GAMM|nr:DnaA regulatory inactivator Hda [Aliidiomarina shirensis]RUO38524.1 DnaA regulatory inactivator Hda [Aliidiomarina shirensis]